MFLRILTLKEIKDEPFVKQNILWDVLPKDMMSPVCLLKDDGFYLKEHIKGYVFYIDNADEKPILSLMRHTAAGYAETLAQIPEIPQEMLQRAIDENKDKVFFMMYPINQEIKNWLIKELEID
ncbi:MAG: DVU0772 family protein [Thermodesulfovibrionales bacterium]